MKNKSEAIINKFKLILFCAVFSFSCLLTSAPGQGTIFNYNSFKYQLIKTALVFIAVFTVTIINKSNSEKITKYTAIFTFIMAFVFFADNYFFNLSGELMFYRLWWLSVIHIACLSVYLAVSFLSDINFTEFFRHFFKGYFPLYMVTFAAVFLRPVGQEATTNFLIGNGTIRFIKYLTANPNDSEIWFLVVGNIIFFVPIAFILKALFPKIKLYHQLLAGIFVPVFIEGYQLVLKCGDVDIDDIVLNFSGFIIGLLILYIQLMLKNKPNIKNAEF